MNVTQKLFLAFVGLTSVVLVATLSLARWSFDLGFVNYIESLEYERLADLSESFSELYGQSSEDWSNVSSTQYREILRTFAPGGRQLPRRGPRQAASPSDSSLEDIAETAPNIRRGPPPHLRGDLGLPPRRFGPPTAIYNIDGMRLAGNKILDLEESISVPVLFNQQAVAYLYSDPMAKTDSISAQAFSQQQLMTSLGIGFLSLLLASVIAWRLSRFLLEPVQKVANGISHLSKGNFSERFSVERQDELGQLMNDIDHLAMILDKNRTAKNRWFADISHELRTPLTILCGEIDAINAGIRPFEHQQLASIEAEVLRIKHLVDDLYQLSLSDVGGLKYHFEPVDMEQCINEVLVALSSQIATQSMEVRYQSHTPSRVSGDKMRLHQLVNNVILNALAYTDSPGQLMIELTTRGNQLLIVFNDSAPSVATEDCELLFAPLYRQDSARVRRTNGAGLGLTICKQIIEAHGGSILAMPSTLGGLCIKMTLPLSKEH
ncbi:ATP-binding protein [Shewanella maritima]|uniref:ATP-binding protein n=1 Tax=Shewanella maritima TaxID=2520507 RepID=UPI0037360F77